jgi:hypothetical protein
MAYSDAQSSTVSEGKERWLLMTTVYLPQLIYHSGFAQNPIVDCKQVTIILNDYLVDSNMTTYKRPGNRPQRFHTLN